MAICIFHHDSTGDLSVDLDRGLYFCHACGAAGNTRTMAHYLEVSEPIEMVPDLSRIRLKLRRLTLPEPDERELLMYKSGAAEVWKEEREFNGATVHKWGLGYDAMNDCLTIPVRAYSGRYIGIIRRRIGPEREGWEMKYRYPFRFPRKSTLFGAHLIRKRSVVITEGSLDAVKVSMAGYDAVATLGTHLSPEQVSVLSKCGVSLVALMLDNDNAGREATQRITEGGVLRRAGIRLALAEYNTTAKDPGELSTRGIKQMLSGVFLARDETTC